MTGSGLHDIIHSTAFDVARNLTLFLFVVFWLGVAYWVRRDAHRRLDDTWLVVTATTVALVPLVGPLVYLLFRPPETLADVQSREVELRALRQALRGPAEAACPVCRSGVQAEFLVCPVCTTQLKQPCVQCKRPLEALWQACPHCATPVGATPVGATPVGATPVGADVEDLDVALTAEAVAIPQKKKRRTGQQARAS